MTDCCSNPGSFINTAEWSQIDYANELQFNTKLWLDHNFLKIGAWTDVETGAEDCGRTDYLVFPIEPSSTLDTGYYYGVDRKGLIWESVATDTRTTLPVTIYENNVDITTGLDINYELGFFSSPVEYDGALTASYSYRAVRTYVSNTATWWREIITNKFDLNEDVIWGVFKKNGISFPSIIIESAPYVRQKAIQIGSNIKLVEQALDLVIVSDSKMTSNKIESVLIAQKDNYFKMFDSNTAEFPIGCNGEVLNNNNYDDLVENFPWKCVQITNVTLASIESPCAGLYLSSVRMYFESANPTKNP